MPSGCTKHAHWVGLRQEEIYVHWVGMTSKDQHQYKDRYMLRLPDGMRERIKSAAAENGRSMNAEIVDTLLGKYPEPFRLYQIEELFELLSIRLTSARDEEQAQQILDHFNNVFRDHQSSMRVELDRNGEDWDGGFMLRGNAKKM